MKKKFPYFKLENDAVLEDVTVTYQTWGKLDKCGTNAILVCHSLTSNADAIQWWHGLIGENCTLDTNKYFIVCANVLGSCYGTTGPTSINPSTGTPFQASFPEITVRDTVRLHKKLLERLGIKQLITVIGGSMGGMQVLEWAFYGDFVKSIIPIAVGGKHSAWCIGWSEAQRTAIKSDPHFNNGFYEPQNPPRDGLSLARQMAMISYRTQTSFEDKFGRSIHNESNQYSVSSYLSYQGKKLVNRFDANSYICLTKLMDSHNIARGRGKYEEVLRQIEQPALVIGIDSDLLYPLSEQRELVEHMPNATLAVINSPDGHDAFLIEIEKMASIITPWIDNLASSQNVQAA